MKFTILLSLFIQLACQTVLNDPDAIYRKDLLIVYREERITGFGSLPKEVQYQLKIETRKEAELVRISSCHRDVVLRDVEDERFSYNYIPSKGIEDKGSCILQIATFDEKGHHQFGAVDFVDDETLPATVYCNGGFSSSDGVTVCQARADTLQVIQFEVPVRAYSTKDCDKPSSEDSMMYTYSVREGYCVYLFSGGKEIHRHTVFGYNDFMKRQ